MRLEKMWVQFLKGVLITMALAGLFSLIITTILSYKHRKGD